MLPNAETVPKECGLNQSETACGLCAGIACRFPCSPATTRDGELYGTSTCECNNNTIFSERTIFTFPTNVVCRAHRPGSGEALMIHAKVERWQHFWINYFSCLRFPFCPGTVSNMVIIIVNWCSLINCNWCVSLDIVQMLALRQGTPHKATFFRNLTFLDFLKFIPKCH